MKKLSKKIISIILSIVSILSLSTVAFASEYVVTKEDLNQLIERDDFSFENKYLILYMQNVMDEDIKIRNITQVADLSGTYRYLYYEIDNGRHLGYAILNVDTLSVEECAFDHVLPFEFGRNMVYGGPLAYLESQKSFYKHKLTGQEFKLEAIQEAKQFQKSENSKILSESEKADNYLKLMSTQSVIKNITGSGNKSWVFNAGSYKGDCGVNAIAMLEKYYDLYVSSSYLPSSLSTEQQIKNSIANYILNVMGYPNLQLSENEWADAITQHSRSVGLNGNYLYGSSSTYSWSSTVRKIDSNRPMTISIKNHPTYGYHYVVVSGYTDTADLGTSRLYVNTGWSSHGFVWINQSYGYRQMPCV